VRAAQDVLARTVRADLVDAAACDQAAVRDHGHAIGERLGFFDVVRGEHDRAAFVDQVAHYPPQASRACTSRPTWAHRETAVGPSRDGHGELHLALLAAGEFAVRSIGDTFQRQAFDHLGSGVGRGIVASHLRDHFARMHHRRED
jgi:hypothetical protein